MDLLQLVFEVHGVQTYVYNEVCCCAVQEDNGTPEERHLGKGLESLRVFVIRECLSLLL